MPKFFLIICSIACLTSCNHIHDQQVSNAKTTDNLSAPMIVDSSAEVAAIMKADSLWDVSSAARSADGWLSFYADDAIMMPPGELVCKDKASREASIKKMFATPGISLRFQDTKAEVSRSRDMGYAAGVYQWSSKDAMGKDYHETGKFCETWKKQNDGNWKCIVDIWNADPAK